jgi:broad specificity phosphatase PhoE
MFSHYVAINAAVGAATGDDRMRIFGPDNCSVTTLDNAGGKLTVVELGRIADTHIN